MPSSHSTLNYETNFCHCLRPFDVAPRSIENENVSHLISFLPRSRIENLSPGEAGLSYCRKLIMPCVTQKMCHRQMVSTLFLWGIYISKKSQQIEKLDCLGGKPLIVKL